ncbi:MAG: hypothetical protein Q4E16_00730 [Neisseria sp.]|nr:hypothetical protein [Neisseria sp.]
MNSVKWILVLSGVVLLAACANSGGSVYRSGSSEVYGQISVGVETSKTRVSH